MSGAIRNRIHRRGELIHATIEGALLQAGMLIGMLLILLVFYVGVWIAER